MRNYDEDLKRLARFAGTDLGFTALAIHALWEKILKIETVTPAKQRNEENPTSIKTDEVVDLLRQFLAQKQTQKTPLYKIDDNSQYLSSYIRSRSLVNGVRHNFEDLDTIKYQSTLDLFETFARKYRPFSSFNVMDEVFQKLRNLTPGDLERREKELTIQKEKDKSFQKRFEEKNEETSEETEAYLKITQQVATLNAELLQTRDRLQLAEQELREATQRAKQADDHGQHLNQNYATLKARSDELRQSVFEKTQELKKTKEQLDNFQELESYFTLSQEMALFTRSQVRYLETILEPNHEQKQALERVKDFQADFLVKGPAGSGKSLVLLLALQKYLRDFDLEVKMSSQKVPFLAYSRTLARYNSFLMENQEWFTANQDAIELQTLDAFLLAVGKRQWPERKLFYDYTKPPETFKDLEDRYTPDFWKEEPLEFLKEVDWIWSYGLNAEEYDSIKRIGRGFRLAKDRRNLVWQAKEKLEAAIEQEPTWPASYYFFKLSQLDLKPLYPLIFVDEVQDLNRTKLAVLRKLSHRGLFMAGDAEQMIFQTKGLFPETIFEKTPQSVVLHQSFRNTQPILDLAEKYLDRTQTEQNRLKIFSSRLGPEPLLLWESKENLARQAYLQIQLLIEKLGYAPENILVVANKEFLDRGNLAKFLEKDKVALADVQQEKFHFGTTAGVRSSSFHSAKGLSFPVVVVLLDAAPGAPRGDEDAESRNARHFQQRRLIYVALTRAMERLVVVLNRDSQATEVVRFKTIANDR
jgi:predicted  nucleic acid-binding Zn-ribbon protein